MMTNVRTIVCKNHCLALKGLPAVIFQLIMKKVCKKLLRAQAL